MLLSFTVTLVSPFPVLTVRAHPHTCGKSSLKLRLQTTLNFQQFFFSWISMTSMRVPIVDPEYTVVAVSTVIFSDDGQPISSGFV